jgi:hypothetical protein
MRPIIVKNLRVRSITFSTRPVRALREQWPTMREYMQQRRTRKRVFAMWLVLSLFYGIALLAAICGAML